MANKPLSDMVVDVIQGADPQAYSARIEKLQHAEKTHSSQKFNDLVKKNKMVSHPKPLTNLYHKSSVTDSKSLDLENAKIFEQRKKQKTYQKFEALMLQNFVKNMFTSDDSTIFGKGQAGETWKSMMAESIGEKMAEAGGIGIAKMLEKSQTLKDKEAQLKQAEAQSAHEIKNIYDQRNIQIINGTIAKHNENLNLEAAKDLAQKSRLSSVQTYLKNIK